MGVVAIGLTIVGCFPIDMLFVSMHGRFCENVHMFMSMDRIEL